MMRHPVWVFVLSLVTLWVAAYLGAALRRRQHEIDDGAREDLGVVLAATLTLLGLVIGFTFSMALSRYDQRKNYEEAEANAIGTQWLRADLLPAEEGARMRARMSAYLEQRILFYNTRDEEVLTQIAQRTSRFQDELWASVLGPAKADPSPLTALAVSGMNDVLNSQSYTQAAWSNRIPTAAWALMVVIAIFANALVGYGSRGGVTLGRHIFILPLVISVAFMLIADIDSPRRGLIAVVPENLMDLAKALGAPKPP